MLPVLQCVIEYALVHSDARIVDEDIEAPVLLRGRITFVTEICATLQPMRSATPVGGRNMPSPPAATSSVRK